MAGLSLQLWDFRFLKYPLLVSNMLYSIRKQSIGGVGASALNLDFILYINDENVVKVNQGLNHLAFFLYFLSNG